MQEWLLALPRLCHEARRVRAIEEEQLKLGREEAEKEIAAHLGPLERKDDQQQEEPPAQTVGRGQ